MVNTIAIHVCKINYLYIVKY